MDQPSTARDQRPWPDGLTRVPYWVYRDTDIARDEQARLQLIQHWIAEGRPPGVTCGRIGRRGTAP